MFGRLPGALATAAIDMLEVEIADTLTEALRLFDA